MDTTCGRTGKWSTWDVSGPGEMWSDQRVEFYDECGFAGDVFLRLAVDGVLVLDPDHADRVIAGLTATLAEVTARCPEQAGLLHHAVVELPKYIEAFRIAKRNG